MEGHCFNIRRINSISKLGHLCFLLGKLCVGKQSLAFSRRDRVGATTFKDEQQTRRGSVNNTP